MSDSDVLNRARFAQEQANARRDARYQNDHLDELRKQLAHAEAESAAARRDALFARVLSVLSFAVSLAALIVSIVR